MEATPRSREGAGEGRRPPPVPEPSAARLGVWGQSPRKTVEHHKNFGLAYARNRADGGNAVSGRSAAKAAARAQLAASRRTSQKFRSRVRAESRRRRQRRQQPPGFQISEHHKIFGLAYARNRADGGNAVSGRNAAQAVAQLAASRRAFKSSEHHKIFGLAYARNRAGGGNAVGGRSAAKTAARAQLAASFRAFKSLNIFAVNGGF